MTMTTTTNEPRSWANRSNTIGAVPGRKDARRETLTGILRQLPVAANEMLKFTMASGQVVQRPADEVLGRHFAACRMTERDAKGGWRVAPVAAEWLLEQNDQKLAQHLHGNVKFFGDLLSHLDGVHSTSELLGLAGAYGLHWTSTDQLYRRLGWFEDLGLLERWAGSKYVVTEAGRAFLATVALIEPAELHEPSADQRDVVLPPPSEALAAILGSSPQTELGERKSLIGYIARGRKARSSEASEESRSIFSSLRVLVQLIGDGVTIGEFQLRCEEKLGVNRASATQTLHALRHMCVIDLIAFNKYGIDPSAAELLMPGNELDFVRFAQTRYRFLGEILPLIETPTPVSDIAKMVREKFSLTQLDNGEVRTRLDLMHDAGLVERLDWTRYRATTLGRLFATVTDLEVPGQSSADAAEDSAVIEAVADDRLGRIAAELRRFSTCSDASAEFEIAVAGAFRLLGFRTEHLGGRGATDVVVEAELPGDDGYRCIIDAKASASGMITDKAIKFDALKEHQRKHRADCGAVVGPDFSDRVRDWALGNGFALLTVEDLITLLRRQAAHPLTLSDLRLIFDPSDNSVELEVCHVNTEHNGLLLRRVVELLHAEALDEDPLMGGCIDQGNLTYVLRKELTPRPSAEAVAECLTFLSHDLVRGVAKDGSKFKLADSPANIARRLGALCTDFLPA
ncbi:hypothetical protein ACXJJ3_27090 [Kribbella sp. WER1]